MDPMFAKDRYISITVAYEAGTNSQPGLGCIAPELKESGLRLVDERDGPRPSRTWAGVVDGPTCEEFANAWRLPGEPSQEGLRAPYSRTFDGLNWQAEGESPIVYVTVRVLSPAGMSQAWT